MGILRPLQRKSLSAIFVFSASFLAVSQYPLPTKVVTAHETVPKSAPSVLPTPTPSPSPEWKPKKPSTLRRVFRHFLSCKLHKLIKEHELLVTGPQLPGSYKTSDFSFPALVQGGWPAVIVYELPIQSSVIVSLEVKDIDPFYEKLAGTGGRKEMMFTIPERFGKTPQAALISITSVPDNPREKKPADLRLYALGMGDEAVGSVPIEVNYPGRINTAKGEKFNYEIRSSKVFNAVKSDFWLSKISKGKHRSTLVKSTALGALLVENTWKPGQWDGRNNVGKFSIGLHILNLNARTSRAPWLLIWTGDVSVD